VLVLTEQRKASRFFTRRRTEASSCSQASRGGLLHLSAEARLSVAKCEKRALPVQLLK
jgi:hypothetical protein